MQSPQPGTGDAVPDYARAWESEPQVVSSVRRPSALPDPQSYHEAIETDAIFELNEKQANGTTQTVFVVPFGCKRCRLSLKQTCSRARPTCVRCKSAGLTCEVLEGGYQKLPLPKFAKPSQVKGSASVASGKNAKTPQARQTSGSSQPRRVASKAAYASQASPSAASGSKRLLSPSPESDYTPPRKLEARAETTSRKRKARYSTNRPSEDIEPMDMERTVPADKRKGNTLSWTFVSGSKKSKSCKSQEHVPSDPLVPRVWTNSLGALSTVFPELTKSTLGFSWFQSETPILLLATNYTGGQWTNPTTLSFDLLWDFSCHDSELEPIIGLGAESSQSAQLPLPQPPVASSSFDYETEMMDAQNSHLPPEAGLPPQFTSGSLFPSASTGCLPSLYGTPQVVSNTPSAYFGLGSSHPTTQSHPGSAVCPIAPLLPNPSIPSDGTSSPNLVLPELDETRTLHTTHEARIPLEKPPEMHTLLDSHLRSIPLLVWMPRDSRLAPCNVALEYAYLCMGYFFISDLRHAVVQHDVSSATGLMQGQVCWSVTLQWAPGGEDALYGCDGSTASDSSSIHTTIDVSHPWWFRPTDTLLQANDATVYRPRDLRMHFFSFIPLDLLAEFYPSESFPRGWFCKTCGMINVQIFFRHQICQSNACRSMHDNPAPSGTVDSLLSLRGLYQSSTIIRPTSNIPSAVVSENISWDDGMQSWVHSIKDGVTLCHVFTGNQEHLQQDATALLERIQREVLLRRDDSSNPYFIHSTKLLHPSDGSEITVPGGTHDCVRVAYYTLCDYVLRYGEMDKPRFGELRIQAWVNRGSKRGHVLHATKSPVAIHCLGAEVVLNFTPKGGYKDGVKPSKSDKGKGRAIDEDQMGSPPTVEHRFGPSRQPEGDNDNQARSILGPETNEMPILAENVEKSNATMDTVRECSSRDAGSSAMPDSNAGPIMEVDHEDVVELRVHKKNKVTKNKGKAKSTDPEISVTLVHGDCVVLYGDDFEYQTVRTGTTILLMGFP